MTPMNHDAESKFDQLSTRFMRAADRLCEAGRYVQLVMAARKFTVWWVRTGHDRYCDCRGLCKVKHDR